MRQGVTVGTPMKYRWHAELQEPHGHLLGTLAKP